ncbi:BglG family transcription antiterminator [Enterococcus sp. AZ103]|uniref:BglG family transcription antiterminator n=1 Tax=Enterococcus sp. AZ103 TaxID=2774628 RepID=UPI003F27EDC3
MNERQVQMIKDFAAVSPKFLTSDFFVEKFGVTTRTVQSDIKRIKENLKELSFAQLFSVTSKGSKLLIQEGTLFQQFLAQFGPAASINQTDRVRQLSIFLLNQKNPITRVKLASRLFVSLSTLDNDLKAANQLFAEYRIQIIGKRNRGLEINASEADKRKCLLKLGLVEMNHEEKELTSHLARRSEIEKTLVGTLLKYQYHVSETLFQNLVVHVELAIQRMKKGFYLIEQDLIEYEGLDSEHQVAKEIFELISQRTSFKFNQAEILNLAIYIKGKSDFENDDYISEEVNDFILNSLTEINEKFDIDLSQEIDLRLSLALHLMPLIIRMKYGMQNHNQLLEEIKLSFPLAFDIAAFMSLLLQDKVGEKVKESEIAYLAIYFNQYLAKYNDLTGAKRILILTSLKRSESILLRQRFATWFPKEISVLTLANTNELASLELEKYDVIFSTEQTETSEKLGALLINYYPSEMEYSKIKLAIDGFKDKSEIIDLFAEARFTYRSFSSKSEVIKQICQNQITEKSGRQDALEKAVLQREELGSCYFGNQIALPHPINPIMTETFVSVILLENDLVWDEEGNKVRLVMLVAIEKNNAKVFQLWNYLGKIIQDQNFVNRLLKNPSFDNFKENLSQILDGYV